MTAERIPGKHASCPWCRTSVYVRLDGSLGAHKYVVNKVRFDCPEGNPKLLRPPRSGRRRTISVDLIVPVALSAAEVRARVHEVLREHFDEAMVCSVNFRDRDAS